MALEEKGDRKPSQFSVDKNIRTVRKALPYDLLLASSKRKVSHLFEELPGAKKHLFAGLDVTGFCGRHFKHAHHYVKQRLHVQAQCCFSSTETIRNVRGGEARTPTSTFTQLLSSAETLQVLYEL